MKFLAHTCVPVLALLLFGAAPSQAQDNKQDNRQGSKLANNMVSLTNPDARAIAAYWTPARLKAARPLPLPLASSKVIRRQAEPRTDEQVQGADGRAPAMQTPPSVIKQLFKPDTTQKRNTGVVSPGAVGIFGAHYTSSRVFPMFTGASAPFSADRAYPYITAGTLFFSIDGQPYLCSASVIQHRIVATAGHCVHSGTSSGFHSNWLFVPAFRDGTAPLLTWNWSVVIVTGDWAFGGGEVPNAADYAMIVFDDQPVGGRTRALGDLTGWLGWQTLSLADNHTSKLGYPCNLDGCEKMQIITSAAFQVVEPNNVEYGSDAEGGSSGGPWIQNFQQLQDGGASGKNNGSNRVVGVTSYGYVPRDPKVQGASIPDGRWINLLSALCGWAPGNCL
ncbi:serine protease [Massilia sp. 2TAF26]|uniref:trypsin-like serine peptidase n=1 Tax=Massilia sp. 2TAF26 TaxID=3233012 RepID=UPI003F96B371